MSQKQYTTSVDLRLVSKDAVYKCVYWYTKGFDVGITMPEENRIDLAFSKRDGSLFSDTDIQSLSRQLERDLIDYNLRDIVAKETANVRDLLVAKAFSHGEFDEAPIGDVSDPVGFDVAGLFNANDNK